MTEPTQLSFMRRSTLKGGGGSAASLRVESWEHEQTYALRQDYLSSRLEARLSRAQSVAGQSDEVSVVEFKLSSTSAPNAHSRDLDPRELFTWDTSS